MDSENLGLSRRRFLTTAATVVGGAGAIATTWPFISTMTPSARAKAIGAPIEVDIGDMKPGELRIEKWQGKPVWILRRNQQTLEDLVILNDAVSDPDSLENQQPDYAKNEYRSRKAEYLVVIGLCTHLGCSPTYTPVDEQHNLGPEWKGGFFCPCHGSSFDLAGRVFKGVPAPANLIVPPYQFLSDTRILIGDDSVVS
jgi:ubiquinol-cytochrome c reductase iron-sulfur subunit